MQQHTATHRLIEQHLAQRRVRYTDGRKTVVDALCDVDGPRSAAELSTDLEASLPLSTLYRTLSVLEDADIVTTHLGTRGIARYELAEWLVGHHHHLVCTNCGAVEDIEVSSSKERQVRELVESIATEAGFTATDHDLEIVGLCARCT